MLQNRAKVKEFSNLGSVEVEAKVKFFQCSTSTFSKWCGSRTRLAIRRRRDSRDGVLILKQSNFPKSGICQIWFDYPQGICYTQSECDERGGTTMGTCASGFGVCCSCKDNSNRLGKNSTEQPNIDPANRLIYSKRRIELQSPWAAAP